MSTTALTSTHRETRAVVLPHPLLSVLVWQFRRFSANRLFWLQALGLFCFLLLLTWLAGDGNASQYPQRSTDSFLELAHGVCC